MKNILFVFILTIPLALFSACNQANPPAAQENNTNVKHGDAKANATGDQPQPSNSNTNVATPTAAAGPGLVPQAVLRGTYAISEVQHDGLVEMISPDNTTEITFLPPASFSRLSKKNGKVNHTDSGEYDVFGNTGLILKIRMSRQQIQTTPVVKRHQFSLSPDGNEFRLTSEKGGIAVFRRIKLLPETN